jgi:thiol-disulfide isomerase/thioredoxin
VLLPNRSRDVRRLLGLAPLPIAILIFLTIPCLANDSIATLKMSRPPAGTVATPFELMTLDGTVVKSSELSGKVVLVNFWATWCGPCKEEMPALARLRHQLDPARFVVLTVTTDLQRQGIAEYLSHLGINLPVLFDEDQEVSRAFMVRGLPTTVVIAQDGTLIGRAVGPRAWDSSAVIEGLQHMVESSQ